MKRFFLLDAIMFFPISTKLIGQTSKRNKSSNEVLVIDVDFTKTSGLLNTFFKECVQVVPMKDLGLIGRNNLRM